MTQPIDEQNGEGLQTQLKPMVTSDFEDPATTPEPLAHHSGAPPSPTVLGFVVLFSAESQVPSGAFIPVRDSDGSPQIFGRGAARAADQYRRLGAVVQRPGGNQPLPAFESSSLSRLQLEVSRRGDGFELLNLGKCQLTINGALVKSVHVTPGDVIEIGRQLLLLCAERPDALPSDGGVISHAYGEPDEHGIVGESPAAWRLRRRIRFVSERTGHVLIHGASGTGKELVAAAIHHLSRPDTPWMARNAATLPETLLDAELYGNAKGYPNVGTPERKGLIGAAHRSSLFLDEFAELPVAAQTHLLRVLDAGEYQRLGETGLRHSDFRLIAATNRPLTDLRTDVLARFAFHIEVPSLSARLEDIPLLARHWLRALARDDASAAHRFLLGSGEPHIPFDFIATLTRLPLSGNARDLRNLLWQAVADSPADVLTLAPIVVPKLEKERSLTAEHLRAVLEANFGSIEKTWRALGLSNRFALMRLMKKHAVHIARHPR